MYCYIYDSFLQQPRYASQLNRIEVRLAELGLQGKTERLTILKNIGEIVELALKRGADTIVAVGNDKTVSKIVNLIAGSKATLGLIPMGEPNLVAALLGVPPGEAACDTLSKRIVKRLDLGRVNSHYFLRSIEVSGGSAVLESDQGYQISTDGPASRISIANFGPRSVLEPRSGLADPADGRLEAVIASAGAGGFGRWWRPNQPRPSVFPVKKVRVTCPTASLALVIDGEAVVKTPATVEVAPGRLKVVVGRDRKF